MISSPAPPSRTLPQLRAVGSVADKPVISEIAMVGTVRDCEPRYKAADNSLRITVISSFDTVSVALWA